jgi:hypothetical protein
MEHSKRSVELCGWAVVYDGSQRGELMGFESVVLCDREKVRGNPEESWSADHRSKIMRVTLASG